MALDPHNPGAELEYLRSLTGNTRRRWLDALLDAGDVRARAAGLFLKRALLQDAWDIGSIPPLISEQSRDDLVQLAVGAGDPAVYALAEYACHQVAQPSAYGSCQRLSLETWAAMDADNAVPWLLLARQAHDRGDAAAETAAFTRAAQARKSDAYNFSLYAFAAPDMPADATPLDRWHLALDAIGIEAAVGSMQYGVLSRHCSSTAVQDEDVRRQCGTLAELLVEKGTTLLDFAVGTSIGERAGWPATRVASLREERAALMGAIEQSSPSPWAQWSCDGVERGNAFVAERVQGGEIGAARAWIERTGESPSTLAQTHRDHLDSLMRRAKALEVTDTGQSPDPASAPP